MNALHPNYAALRDVVNFVEYSFREESERTGCCTTISLPSFSTPAHIPVILRDPHYSVYKYISLPSLEFEDLNELEVLLRDSTISSPPPAGKFIEITLSNPMFRSILIRPVDTRAPDFRTLVLHNVAIIDLQLWSDVLKPFVRLTFSDVNRIILFGPGRTSVPTCWARNIISLKFSNVSMSRDTLYQIICSCLKLDILILGHIHLTVTEAPTGTAALVAANHIHDLKKLSLFNFPNAHMADFLKLIRKSSRVKISVRSLRKLIIVMDPTLNSVLSADLKYELTALLRDNLFRRSGEAPSKLKELRVVCEAFDGYISGNVLPQVSLATLIRHSRLSKVTLDLWEKLTMPIQLLGRIVDGLPTHASLDIVFSTSGNVPKELEVLDGAITERSASNEVAQRKAQENFKKFVWRQSIHKGYLAIKDSIA
ncbi:hypothetical protein ARMSODRAFT_1008775 [Armillaria solidipes]|uniref:Uncharacterized protein n=1 Tax=Armillaria solidipes TaxID=1076256 RepID=A0A2H3BEB4_9AGAR|nr:hypothetical protein ARMSODRAFT_1008775 [Armillaria solidipes]